MRKQTVRDALSARLFAATEAVARYDWGAAGIKTLLRQVSAAMSEEVGYLEGLPVLSAERALSSTCPEVACAELGQLDE